MKSSLRATQRLINSLLVLSLVCFFAPAISGPAPAGAAPFAPPTAQDLQPFLGPMSDAEAQEFNAILASPEFNAFIASPEFNEMVQELEQKIESGEIDIKDIFPGADMSSAAPQAPAPKQPTPEKPVELPVAKPAVVEKPKPALRNKSHAQLMLTTIIDRITSLRLKAATYCKIKGLLEPWDAKLDLLIYSIHLMARPDMIELLITDAEFLPLHDALKILSEALTQYEPAIVVPEFGLEAQDPIIKDRSKIALKNLLSSLDIAFAKQHLLPEIEKLFKKYKPRELEKIKAQEAAIKRAEAEAQSMKSWQQSPACVERESKYATRGFKFYDWYYGRQQPGYQQQQQERMRSGRRAEYPSGRPEWLDQEQPQPGSKSGAATPRAGAKEQEQPTQESAQPEEKKQVPYTAPKPVSKENERVEQRLGELEDMLDDYYPTEEIPPLADYLNVPFNLADIGQHLAMAKTINDRLADIGQAIHKIGRIQSALKGLISKLPPALQSSQKKRLADLLEKLKNKFQPLYDAILAFSKKTNNELRSGKISRTLIEDGPKLFLHMGYETLTGRPVDPRIKEAPVAPAMHGNVRENPFRLFQDAHETTFAQTTKEEQRAIWAALDERELRNKERASQPSATPSAQPGEQTGTQPEQQQTPDTGTEPETAPAPDETQSESEEEPSPGAMDRMLNWVQGLFSS